MPNPRLWMSFIFLALLLAACKTQYPETCPSSTPVGLMQADAVAGDNSLAFRFPLDESPVDETLYFGWFGISNECPPGAEDCFNFPVREFHAAEDYRRPPGTPVYAMADGRISFSGRAGGYGWLILIDHPQANLYSLYGHLSPSRWKLATGTEVKKGDLVAYLGDPDENGGSVENPLDPHLHFGLRAGQTADYPSRGEWRFMAGWIKPCPQELGWLQPSLVITSQHIPFADYPAPQVGFLVRWGVELVITGAYTLFGLGTLLYAIKKNKSIFMLFPAAIVILAGFVLHNNRVLSTYALLVIGIFMLASGTYLYLRRATAKPLDQSM